MAGSRLERFGTVFTRVRDLMRSEVIKPTQKPVWYDVFEAFPPKRNPLYERPIVSPRVQKQDTVPEIFYREDEVRARFYEQYGAGPQLLDLSKSDFVSTCQRFIDKYTELQNNSDLSESALFEETGKALLKEGVILRRKGVPPVSAESRDPTLELNLADMMAEQQAVDADAQETPEHTPQT